MGIFDKLKSLISSKPKPKDVGKKIEDMKKSLREQQLQKTMMEKAASCQKGQIEDMKEKTDYGEKNLPSAKTNDFSQKIDDMKRLFREQQKQQTKYFYDKAANVQNKLPKQLQLHDVGKRMDDMKKYFKDQMQKGFHATAGSPKSTMKSFDAGQKIQDIKNYFAEQMQKNVPPNFRDATKKIEESKTPEAQKTLSANIPKLPADVGKKMEDVKIQMQKQLVGNVTNFQNKISVVQASVKDQLMGLFGKKGAKNVLPAAVKGASPPGGGDVSGRAMKFPYTFSGKVVQFPWRYHYNYNWMCRYYVYAFVASIPVFLKLTIMSNSPENKKKWAEIKKKESEEVHHLY